MDYFSPGPDVVTLIGRHSIVAPSGADSSGGKRQCFALTHTVLVSDSVAFLSSP